MEKTHWDKRRWRDRKKKGTREKDEEFCTGKSSVLTNSNLLIPLEDSRP